MKRIKYLLCIFFFALLFNVTNIQAASFTLGTTHGTTDPNSLIVTEPKNLIVSNVPDGDILTAYKIIDVFYNPTTNALYYEFTSDFQSFLTASTDYRSLTVEAYSKLTSGNITNGSTLTVSSLDRLVSSYVVYIKDHELVGTDLATSSTNRLKNLPIGSYLVIPKTTSKIYAVMVGNLSLSKENGVWTSHDQTIVAKVSDPGIVTKTIAGNKITDSTYIGIEITYNITGTVPQYPTNATNKKYTITDTMASGLTFSGITSMNITDGTTRLIVNPNGEVKDRNNKIVANINVTNQVITIDFNLDNVKSTEIIISYKAKLNEQAILGGEGNKNKAKLTYAVDPYKNSTQDSEETTTTVYTYGLEILKYSENDKSAVLKGAQFDVYSNASLTTKVGTITSNENGLGTLKGLPAATYYLKETKAPIGHLLLTETIPIKIAIDDATPSPTRPGYYYIEISNNKNLFLPFTGGLGTYIYTIIGMSIIVIAVIVFIIYRKRRENGDNDEK